MYCWEDKCNDLGDLIGSITLIVPPASPSRPLAIEYISRSWQKYVEERRNWKSNNSDLVQNSREPSSVISEFSRDRMLLGCKSKKNRYSPNPLLITTRLPNLWYRKIAVVEVGLCHMHFAHLQSGNWGVPSFSRNSSEKTDDPANRINSSTLLLQVILIFLI